MTKIKVDINNQILSEFLNQVYDNLIWESLSKGNLQRKNYRDSEIVYHYTSFDSLFKIISTESLISSNILYLNDTAEYREGIKAFKLSLTGMLNKSKVSNRNKEIVSQILMEIDNIKQSENYVTCFSAEKDMLSQWHSYGERGNGVSIGFSIKKLDRCFQVRPIGSWVDYDHDAKLKRLNSINVEFFRSYTELLKQGSFADRKSIVPVGVELYLNHIVPVFLSHYKNSSFKAEKEYRLALKNSREIPIEIEFSTKSNSQIIPYTRLILKKRFYEMNPIEDSATIPTTVHNTLPIEEIILGPCVNRNFTEPGLRAFLDNIGYAKVKITQSNIPLRNVS